MTDVPRRLSKFTILAFIVAAVALVLLVQLFQSAPAPTAWGISMVLVGTFGFVAPALLLGLLGLFYKADRVLGYIVASSAFLALMVLGMMNSPAQAAPSEPCNRFEHASKPWAIEWAPDATFSMLLGTEPMIQCSEAGPQLLNGQVPLQCGGASATPDSSWYAFFDGPDGSSSSVMLWGNEVYYLSCP